MSCNGRAAGGIAWMSHGVMIVVIFTLTSQGRVVSPTRVLNNILPKVILHTGVYMYARIICIFLAINLFHVAQVVIFIL